MTLSFYPCFYVLGCLGLRPGTEYGMGVTAMKDERESQPATTNAVTGRTFCCHFSINKINWYFWFPPKIHHHKEYTTCPFDVIFPHSYLIISLLISLPALDAPKDLAVTEVTETTMTLQWKRPMAKLDSYRLVYMSADGQKDEATVPASADTHTFRSLTPGMLYTIKITAERGRRTSAPASISAPTGQQ